MDDVLYKVERFGEKMPIDMEWAEICKRYLMKCASELSGIWERVHF
ncbi:hypothetical protein M1589_03540 [Candidatus Marsarchaeota archaeon]|nr:hypothetical protein [Candidatus Marsarchaeota archaeon]